MGARRFSPPWSLSPQLEPDVKKTKQGVRDLNPPRRPKKDDDDVTFCAHPDNLRRKQRDGKSTCTLCSKEFQAEVTA